MSLTSTRGARAARPYRTLRFHQRSRRRAASAASSLALATLLVPGAAFAQGQRAAPAELPSIEEKTAGLERLDGYFPLYWDATLAQVWMEIPRQGEEVLHIEGLGAGLGSNDIGLDRGALQGSRVVVFERIGRRIMMVQPNYDYRAISDNPSEVRAVRDAFARSVLFSWDVAAETDGRVLVNMNPFLLRDGSNIAGDLSPGTYRLDTNRSSVYRPMTMNFPENTELEVELTFVQQPGGGGGRGGAFFEGVGSVAATGAAASLRLHHSFVKLPGPGFEQRAYDPRAGYGGFSYQDYAAPLGESMTKRFIRRHRLEKRDPNQAMGDPVEPIVYYLDPGAPEPIRSALLEGASWWNQAFEAAGYRNAFRVEIRPDSISPFDVRYNVINWVHRSTRGWSYGASVTDPRTGEIIKGVVTLGSLRVRQDYLIAEGLLSPYEDGTERPPELIEWALARVRQLAAHEVGHTLGLGHNYYDSEAGRISVMDYPHPLVALRADGSLDYSDVYESGIGEWDSVAIAYGYRDFPAGTDEAAALERILDDAWDRDIRYLTNQDIATHPRADQWSNGTDAAAELNRMLEVRSAALARFGERAIRTGMPMATIEEVLVPLYLHHRYQVEAAGSAIGGVDYIYALRGDGRQPFRRASGSQQRAALDALLATLEPAALALPRPLLGLIPPRPSGFGSSRELFPKWTGNVFDALAPAVVAADHTMANILDPSKAARLVEQHALDPSLPGLDEVIDRLFDAPAAPARDDYDAEILRVVDRLAVERVIDLAASAPMPQVRAIATLALEHRMDELGSIAQANGDAQADGAQIAHANLLATDIRRFLERPAGPYAQLSTPTAPPGAPIGQPAMDWLGGNAAERWFGISARDWLDRLETGCAWEEYASEER